MLLGSIKKKFEKILNFPVFVLIVTVVLILLIIFSYLNYRQSLSEEVNFEIGETVFQELDEEEMLIEKAFLETLRLLENSDVYINFDFENSVPFDNGIFQIIYLHSEDKYLVVLNYSIENVESIFSKWLSRIDPSITNKLNIVIYDPQDNIYPPVLE